MFESTLMERIENIVKMSPEIETGRLAQELIKQYPSDYQELPLKHFKLSVNNFQKNVSKKLQKLEHLNEAKKRPGELSQSSSKRLKTDDDPALESSELSKENTSKIKKKTSLKEYLRKRQEKMPDISKIIHPTENFSNLDGLEEALKVVKKWMSSQKYRKLGIRGLLIGGAAGCGKTLLAKAIAGEKQCPIICTTASDIFQGLREEKLGNLRKLFAQAENLKQCYVLIEDLDEVSNKSQSGSDQRLKSQDAKMLRRCVKEISPNSRVYVIGTTERLDDVDLALRRKGVFGKTVNLKIPDLRTRAKLLRRFSEENHICYELNQENDNREQPAEEQDIEIKVRFEVDFDEIAQSTPGYSGEDLKALVEQAVTNALERCQKDMQRDSSTLEVLVRTEDFLEALEEDEPTAMIEDLISVPKTTWKEVGGLENIQEILKWNILNRIKNPEIAKRVGLHMPVGIMLFGPPGCGKTLIAKAMANEASLNFLSVRGPELMDKYVGESEKNIRGLFQRAKNCTPCLIFFDEIDSICEKRSPHAEGGAKVVQQLLAELDGVASRVGVYVMGATNRIDCVDPAFLRGNRFGTVVQVGLPTAEGRLEILKCHTKVTPLAEDVDLEALARHDRCKNFNGADLMQLVQNATTLAWKEAHYGDVNFQVSQTHFLKVLLHSVPSVKESDLERYDRMAGTSCNKILSNLF